MMFTSHHILFGLSNRRRGVWGIWHLWGRGEVYTGFWWGNL